MKHFVTQALQNKTSETKEGWCALVRRNWSMECEFEGSAERELRMASWQMGDWRFEALDLSAQQWIWKPGPGLHNWRATSLIMLLNESGTVEIEQDDQTVTLTEGSLLVFDGSIKYRQTSCSNSRSVAIRVPKASLDASAGLLSNRAMFMLEPVAPNVALLISHLASATAFGERCSVHSRGVVAQYLTALMQLISDDLAVSAELATSSVVLRRVKLFLDRNVGNEKVDMDAVANAIGLSKRQVFRIFEREGFSATRYLLLKRLTHARRMLVSGGENLRINDVAWRCGFVSAAHFSRAFKKEYGESPMTFKRNHAT
jgi:AraC-like DNA-binding protein